jgi:hypothetical protein
MKTRKLKLKEIKESHKPAKKYDAVFITDDKEKTVSFGASGYNDFILFNEKEGAKVANMHKERYLNRHRKNEHWDKPDTPGALSRYILWNKKTLKASVRDYKKRFGV